MPRANHRSMPQDSMGMAGQQPQNVVNIAQEEDDEPQDDYDESDDMEDDNDEDEFSEEPNDGMH